MSDTDNLRVTAIKALDEIEKRIVQAERERDEARLDAEQTKAFRNGMHVRNYKEMLAAQERLEQAVALLREAPDKSCDCEEGRTCCACEYNTRKDAFLAGQTAPVAPAVDDAMVFNLCAELHYRGYNIGPLGARSALVAALEGKQ